MRTTVDIPDSLMERIKARLNDENLTFRSLVISALEKSLNESTAPFHLRDASVGGERTVSSEEINSAIDDLNEVQFKK